MQQEITKRKPVFLIVDDDPMVRKIVARGLEALEPEAIFEVEDGIQAQGILLNQTIDVVVTDVLMPNMDGRELMKWANEHAKGPLWIVLSGLDTFDAAVDAIHLGAFDFLSKPITMESIRIAVRNALDQLDLINERERLYAEIALSHDRLTEKVQQLESVCHMLEEQADVIQSDLQRAEVIQRALLPQLPPKIGRWCIETLYQPGSNVGGDYYDVVPLDDRHLGIVIADAAGHGVAAAMLSVLFKLRLELLEEDGETAMAPKDVLASLNKRLFDDMTGPGMFITAIYALLDRRTGKMKFASAGHPPGVWISRHHEPHLHKRTGPALGLRYDAEYEETSLVMEAGDRFFFYTDGVLEGGPKSPAVEDFGARLADDQTEREELLKDIYLDATYGVDEDRDDITMILLERNEGISRFNASDKMEKQEATPEPAVPSTSHLQMLQGSNDNGSVMTIAGSGNWMASTDFYECANRLLKRKHRLTIDLGACEHLDSTFLGTLHEIAMSNPQAVRLQRVPENIKALFEELDMSGLIELISVLAEPTPDRMQPLRSAEKDVGEQGQRVLRSHEILATLSDENQERFRGVVEALKADLESSESLDPAQRPALRIR